MSASKRPRVLILSASIGEGHDLPARVLARALEPRADTETLDVFAVTGRLVEAVAQGGMRATYGAGRMHWLFDVEYLLFARIAPTRRAGQALLYRLTARRLLAAVEECSPDVVVATFPIASEVLGRLRLRGRLAVPVCSVITDLTGLNYWAHRGCDLHLLAYPESLAEVEQIAGEGSAAVVRGLTDPAFLSPPSRREARAALDIPEGRAVVAVSGGGWGVGDLAGAVAAAQSVSGVLVICLCGRNEALRRQLKTAFDSEPRVRVLGFVDEMAMLLAASDVLIHSTAGLTALEAHMVGCRVISYGLAIGHIRLNNSAFARLGFAEVVGSARDLPPALERALAQRGTAPTAQFAVLPAAADLVLGLASAHADSGAARAVSSDANTATM